MNATGNKYLPSMLLENKKEFLDILFKVWCNSTRKLEKENETQAKWRIRVWANIELIAQAYLARAAERPSKIERERTQDLLDSLTNALRRAKTLLKRQMYPPSSRNIEFGPIYPQLLLAWQRGENLLALTMQRNRPLPAESEETLRTAYEALRKLEGAAARASQNSRGKRGGQRKHMDQIVLGLADIFETATGEKANKGNGPFLEFVNLFFQGVGHTKADALTLIKRSLPKKSST